MKYQSEFVGSDLVDAGDHSPHMVVAEIKRRTAQFAKEANKRFEELERKFAYEWIMKHVVGRSC